MRLFVIKSLAFFVLCCCLFYGVNEVSADTDLNENINDFSEENSNNPIEENDNVSLGSENSVEAEVEQVEQNNNVNMVEVDSDIDLDLDSENTIDSIGEDFEQTSTINIIEENEIAVLDFEDNADSTVEDVEQIKMTKLEFFEAFTGLADQYLSQIGLIGLIDLVFGDAPRGRNIVQFSVIALNTLKHFANIKPVEGIIVTPVSGQDKNDYADYVGADDLKLTVWNIEDGHKIFSWLIESFENRYPNISIEFISYANEESYWNQLLIAKNKNALPDIFVIKDSWMREFQSEITGAPEPLFSVERIESEFYNIVKESFCENGVVMAVPLFVRSLGMFSNANLLLDDRITIGDRPEGTWKRFLANYKNYREYGNKNTLFLSIDLQKNHKALTDLFLALLLQAGLSPHDQLAGQKGALDALDFLMMFVDPKSKANDTDLKLFQDGKMAILLGNELLDQELQNFVLDGSRRARPGELLKDALQVHQIPQLSEVQPVVSGEAWGFAVAKKAVNVDTAWAFVHFLAQKSNAEGFAKKTNKISAYRDISTGFFADNAKIAKSLGIWGHPQFPKTFQEIFVQYHSGSITREEVIKQIDLFFSKKR